MIIAHFADLDVSQNETAICIVDGVGRRFGGTNVRRDRSNWVSDSSSGGNCSEIGLGDQRATAHCTRFNGH